MIHMNGCGYKGAPSGWWYAYQGESYAGEFTTNYSNNYGGGGPDSGGGYGTKGNDKYGGMVYDNIYLDKLHFGSGGGGAKGGRGGGGVIQIDANEIFIGKMCEISCIGKSVRIPAGGGSGGSIYLICNKLKNNGYINAVGADELPPMIFPEQPVQIPEYKYW